MKLFASAIMFALALTTPALAENVGIDFASMPVGTALVTETRDDDKQRYTETYIRKEGDFHVVELSKLKDGAPFVLVTRFFDTDGRLVRTEKKGKLSSSNTPFSCEYVLGPCEQVYVYANPFKNGKLVTNNDSYNNRLDGKILTVAKKRLDGSFLEFPYELGKYNLRISSEYTNALGQVRGFKLIEIVEP